MAVEIIPSFIGTSSANTANTTYVLEAGSALDGSAVSYAIDATDAVGGRVFMINGKVVFNDFGLGVGVDLSPETATRVVVGLGGLFYGQQNAIMLFGEGHSVINNGSIFASAPDSLGIFVQGAAGVITNRGVVEADTAITAVSDGALVRNYGAVTGNCGISVDATDGAATRIENFGLINGNDFAVKGVNGNDTVINSGGINGDVDFGSGNDRFINKGGELNGTIFGGLGNDVYQFDRRTFNVVEEAAGGSDTVRSAGNVDVFSQEIETIILTGKRNVNVIAGDIDNVIIGNAGNNNLQGSAGADTLRGGKGNDVLTGGVDADIFVFRLDGSTDRVTDYEDELDRIDLSAIDGLSGFRELKKKYITQQGDDVVISDGDTTVILVDTLKGVLDADDFIL